MLTFWTIIYFLILLNHFVSKTNTSKEEYCNIYFLFSWFLPYLYINRVQQLHTPENPCQWRGELISEFLHPSVTMKLVHEVLPYIMFFCIGPSLAYIWKLEFRRRRFQRLLDYLCILIQTQIMPNLMFWPKMPKYGNSAQTPEIDFFWKIVAFSDACQYYASNETSTTAVSVFGAQNAQIWKFGLRPPHLTFLKNCYIFRCLLSLRFRRAFNHYPTIIFGQIMTKCPQNHCLRHQKRTWTNMGRCMCGGGGGSTKNKRSLW